jgi:hypothetical protein
MKKRFKRKGLQFQRMNADGREERRSQNKDKVRAHQGRVINKVMTKTKPISGNCNNNENHQPIMLYYDELKTKSNVLVFFIRI